MSATRKTLHDLINLLSDKDLDQVESFLTGFTSPALNPNANSSKRVKPCKRGIVCCYCGKQHVIGNGTTRKGVQRYRCLDCKKSFCETTGSVVEYSHQDEAVWKMVISDTIDGVSMAHTAKFTGLTKTTISSMRHKILCGIETALSRKNIVLTGFNQADETFVRDSYKGTKLPQSFNRGPRKHGTKGMGSGSTSDHIVICTSVAEDGSACIATPVKRTAISGDDLVNVFGNKVTEDTVIICDNCKKYNKLIPHCLVSHDKKRINMVNSFHSYMKSMLVKNAHGVATKYLNRYVSLYRQVFGHSAEALQQILDIVKERDDRFVSIEALRTHNLLVI